MCISCGKVVKKNSFMFDKFLYYKILCKEFPEFLKKYLNLPILNRLAGVGLLCGTDWTPLYNNRFFYSRLDHSIGVALIIWNFTHDKKQALAGLFHDVSTPAFSHVSDFRSGDVIKQESTEEENKKIIHDCTELTELLKQDGLKVCNVDDYHRFPVADNEIPHLSADRLEYMFPSGIILNGSFDMESTERLYKDICIYNNELGEVELAFKTEACALEYCKRFCNTGLVLQHNENKIALQLLADILSIAFELRILSEENLFSMSEKQIIDVFDSFVEVKNFSDLNRIQENSLSLTGKGIINTYAEKSEIESKNNKFRQFVQYYKTFRTMKKIERSDTPKKDYYNLSLEVKKRYINPLVASGKNKGKRITQISAEAEKTVEDFLSFSDSRYGCVKLVDI